MTQKVKVFVIGSSKELERVRQCMSYLTNSASLKNHANLIMNQNLSRDTDEFKHEYTRRQFLPLEKSVTIVHDWTASFNYNRYTFVQDMMTSYLVQDLQAVRDCDVVWYLASQHKSGAAVELGYAYALEKKTVVSREQQHIGYERFAHYVYEDSFWESGEDFVHVADVRAALHIMSGVL